MSYSFLPAAEAEYLEAVQFYLEDLLQCPVDLVTEKALRPELRPFIEREMVNVRARVALRQLKAQTRAD